jgi:hypothetical protein
MVRQKKLLAIVELGGYPDLTMVYEAAGHEVRTMRTLRKALSVVRDWEPDIVVSEFRYSPTYGSQLGNLESIIAALQRHVPGVRLIVLYDRDRQEQLQQLAARLPFHAALAFPLDIKALQRAVQFT